MSAQTITILEAPRKKEELTQTFLDSPKHLDNARSQDVTRAKTSTLLYQHIHTAPKEHSMIGQYEDLGLIGSGGMGEVRRVREQFLNRSIAMKILHSRLLHNPEACARFIEEAQIGAKLQHPNIVPVYEFGILPDQRLYFTMKEIRGRELGEDIRSFWTP